jgi:hypothetical protein
MRHQPSLYGLLAEFDDPDKLVAAARRVREAGYRRVDAYSPYPIEELADALGFQETWIPLIVLIGGVAGAVGGYLLQYYASVVDYPLNVGGRPLHSWPAFVPVTFETAILGAALAAVLGMLALNGLPRPHHPIFNVPRFARATQDAFFLIVEASDPKFDYEATRNFLLSLSPRRVSDVPH